MLYGFDWLSVPIWKDMCSIAKEGRFLYEDEWKQTDVPLLVGFNDGSGYVLFSSFHYRAQNTNVVDTTLLTIIEGLNPGSAYEQ